MTDLIACLTTGKGTWAYVIRLMQAEKWDKVILVTNQFGKERFTPPRDATFLLTDENKPLPQMIDEIKKQLESLGLGADIAINFISGSGKEHMAMLAASLKLGLSTRFVALTDDGTVIEV